MNTLDPPWSVNVKCAVVVHQTDGLDTTYLVPEPGNIIVGELVISSLMRPRGILGKGKCYRVTFEEIPAFDG